MSEREQVILADLTWINGRFEREVAVQIDADGRIARVETNPPTEVKQRATRLTNRALLPGMTYAHSHAFQRALRNHPEKFDAGSGNFWTWRDTMYALVESLDVESFYDTCRQCFREMLLGGVTSVGEFHYVHHAGDEPRFEFDDAILRAARDAGIRITLIQCYYATGGMRRPLEGAQRRFDSISLDVFLRQFERLARILDPSTQSLAVAAHSIRAATMEDIELLYRHASDIDVPFHIHVEEQRQEIRDCIEAYGRGPLRLLLERLPIDPRFTAIHCTHSEAEDLRELASRGGRVCLCPSTEGNLADGVPKVREMRDAGIPICMGSDCNLRLCMSEDLRWLEFAQRITREQSGIITNASGDVAPALFELATTNGAAAIGVDSGRIEARQWADLFAIDLAHPSLIGIAPESLLHAFVFGCGNEPITATWVGGRRV